MKAVAKYAFGIIAGVVLTIYILAVMFGALGEHEAFRRLLGIR